MATTEVVEATTNADPTSPTKKRKNEIDEIEVDLSLPEPPSKKAKRLLKKGKPLPVKPDSDEEPDDGLLIPKINKETKDKKSQRSEHGIWIGNLPFTMTRVELFKWLVEQSGGAIKEENITRVNLPTSKLPKGSRHDGEQSKPQNRGFAYVDFDVEAAAVSAMALTETELGGRKVLIKNSKSFEGRPQKEVSTTENSAGNSGPAGAAGATPAGRKNATSRKIYVGNLSFQTDEDDLRAQFEKCGEIEWVKVATFEDTGKCKGFGWVKFKEPESAEWAVKGFVKIKEDIETEDDFREAEDQEGTENQEKKFKMRKWWVNRLKGRELKIDFAEDDQSRYRKRFGKDRPAGNGNPGRPQQDRGRPGSGPEEWRQSRPRPERDSASYGEKGVASYLTGSVVKPEGKKITFD
ncbi:hypothetical protein F5Y15DRAFT_56473 [Xylariaceae sp. FL0016]|nr:hypothetical protein F5Y15DRAFT_56473 [Xylariaceae sp. FL0016]